MTISVWYLLNIMSEVLDAESTPEDWRHGVIVESPKKGDLLNCNKGRGITLLSVAGKVYILLRGEQTGFPPGRSCSNQITTLRITIE